MKVGTFTKQPGERISKSIVYTDALDEGDYIETVESCSASPAGITVNAGLSDNERVRVWFDDGVDKTKYTVTVVVTTHQGERFEDEIVCDVREVSR